MLTHAEHGAYCTEHCSRNAVKGKCYPLHTAKLNYVGKSQNLPYSQVSRKEGNQCFIGNLSEYPCHNSRQNSYKHSLNEKGEFYKGIGSADAFHYAYLLAAGKNAGAGSVVYNKER